MAGSSGSVDAEKTPPHDDGAERAFLGAGLLDPACLDIPEVAAVQPRDLYHETHRLILSTMLDLRSRGIAVDAVTVMGAIADAGRLADVDDGLLLKDLLDEVPHANHATYYAERVRRLARRRRKLVRVREALDVLRDPQSDDAAVDALLAEDEDDRDAGRERFRDVTAAELDAMDLREDYDIPGIAARRQDLLIGGSFKALKTSCGADFGLSLATGRRFLGEFPARAVRRVSILSGESGKRAIQSMLRRMAAERGVLLSQVDGLFVSSDLPQLCDPSDVRALERYVRARDLDYLIVDPIYMAMDLGNDAANVFAVGKHLRPVTEVGKRTGCTMVVIHHLRKHLADPYSPAELGDVAMAGFAEWAAQWILLSRRAPFDPETGHHELWMNVGGRAGHCGLWGVDIAEGVQDESGNGRVWQPKVLRATAVRESVTEKQVARKREKADEQRDANRSRIVAWFEKHPAGETKSQCRESLGMSTGPFGQAFTSLVDDETLVACKVQRENKQSYPGFRLSEPTVHNVSRTDSDTLGQSECSSGEAHTRTDASIEASDCPSGAVLRLTGEACPSDRPGRAVTEDSYYGMGG